MTSLSGKDWKDRCVLVTGASGFLGPPLCRRLTERGARVHAVSRRVEEREADGVCWSPGDMSRMDSVNQTLDRVRPDVIFHLAGLGRGAPRKELVIPTFESNLVTTVNLLTALAERGDGRLIMASSMEEPESPFDRPSSPYAVSKWAASEYARMFHGLFGVKVVLARIFVAYGPGKQDLGKVLPHVITSLLRGEAPELSAGERRVDWIFVEDVAEGLISLAEGEGLDGRTVDIGSGELLSVREMVERVAAEVGTGIRPRFGVLGDRKWEGVKVANSEATFDLVGWRAATLPDEGVARTVEWYASESGVVQ